MAGKNTLLEEALTVVREAARSKEEYHTALVNGREMRVSRIVFSPKNFPDTEFFAPRVAKLVGTRSFLEIGPGCGAIALEVALESRREVTAIDINPKAIDSTRVNFARYGARVDARIGDLFEPLQRTEKFESIFFNHAWHCDPVIVRSVSELAIMDPDYYTLGRFFREGKRHLAEKGELLLGTSTIANLSRVFDLARAHGYRWESVARGFSTFSHENDYRIELYIYRFIPS